MKVEPRTPRSPRYIHIHLLGELTDEMSNKTTGSKNNTPCKYQIFFNLAQFNDKTYLFQKVRLCRSFSVKKTVPAIIMFLIISIGNHIYLLHNKEYFTDSFFLKKWHALCNIQSVLHLFFFGRLFLFWLSRFFILRAESF